jgi:putative ABC transport system permease protein
MITFRQVPHVLIALKKHRAATALLVLTIGLTMAILANIVFVVYGSLQRAKTPTGVVENKLGIIHSITVMNEQNGNGTLIGNLSLLKRVPGVANAAYEGGAPLLYVQQSPAYLNASRQNSVADTYELLGSQGLSKTLGVKIVEGRNLSDQDTLPDISKMSDDVEFPVLITRSLATRLFPDGRAVGKIFYDGTSTLRVIGIMSHLRSQITGRENDDFSIVKEFNVGMQNAGGVFLIQSRNANNLPETLRAAAAALRKANPGHVQAKIITMPELRANYFQGDKAVGRMLIAILFVLLSVTAFGISGFASFWVQQRVRQIGVRRALGATRSDILRYFLAENFLIVSAGIVLGCIFGYTLNVFLMNHFEISRLPVVYLLVGAVVLWLLGQMAVLAPALRASMESPASAR